MLYLTHTFIWILGNYKVQLYDPRTNGFSPSTQGIGMHVEIRDPDDKIILSKVSDKKLVLYLFSILANFI